MDSTIPFYLQVKNYIKHSILEGELKPGDIIPSERELMKQFGLSRSTIRKAIKELEYEGYLVKVQGKGTFVSKHNIEKELIKVINITHREEEDSQNVLEYETIAEQLLSSDEIDIKLPDSIPGLKIYYLERKTKLDDIVVGIDEIWSSSTYINEIAGRFVDDIEKLGTRVIEDISIGFADKKQAKILNIKQNAPLLKIEKKIYKENLIIYIQSLYNSEKVKLTRVNYNKEKAANTL
ncbi:MAG: GntR family transcriptional regulator [Halanaerobiaceae bacterium]|nr:GntR family transcriptional regulator [Halanaerobiaceae bacterium]